MIQIPRVDTDTNATTDFRAITAYIQEFWGNDYVRDTVVSALNREM